MPLRAAACSQPQPRPRPFPALDPAGGRGGKTLREQILLHPDGYIGPLEKRTQKLWVRDGVYMAQRLVTYSPGLLKIFDEMLVYAADGKQRDPAMDILRVNIDVVNCRISVYNNGEGIPIEIHQGEGVYVPEKIFGHISNFDPDAEEDGITRKRNGFGVKLANIFSTEFVVEIADGPSQKKYNQVFSENMGKKSEPKITGHRKGVNYSWTMVTFKPDLAKFNMTHLEEDVIALMQKRVFDMAGILGGTVQVVCNGRKMHLPRGFRDFGYQYMPVSIHNLPDLPWVYEEVNDQWKVGVTLSGGEFQQVSFVNKVATISGGTHVDYVSDLIVAHVVSFMKGTLEMDNIKEHDVKRHLMVFINLLMENPTFSSPTKEALTTPKEGFGSDLEFSEPFLMRARTFLFRKLSGII